MKKTKITSLILLFLIGWNSHAQDFEFMDFGYSSAEYKIDSSFQDEEEIILEKNIKSEFVFNDEAAIEYLLIHEKKLINSDNAIERNNRVYIPTRLDDNLIVNKLQVILKDGKIIELETSDIKEETDERSGMKYNYFAVNGLEKGSIIERFYIIKRTPQVTGNSIRLQGSAPILRASIELIFPEHLIFDSVSYNGFPEAESRLESYDNKNSLYVEARNIPSIPLDEVYSNVSKYMQRFSYKLDENTYLNIKNIYNHADYAKNLFESYNKELTKGEERTLENFVKRIPTLPDFLKQIQTIESHVKENIQYNRFLPTSQSLSEVIKNKQGDLFNLIELYVQIFKKMKVDYEIVFTTERFKDVFDPNFESLLNFKEVLFYFPEVDVYMEPTATVYRIPMFDYQFGSNYGLFVKAKSFGSIEVPVSEIKIIEFPENQGLTKMDIRVDFAKNIVEPLLTSRIKFDGYQSLNFQPAIDFADAVEYQELLDVLARNYAFDSEIESVKAENEGLSFVGKEHFILNVEANVKDLITKAGDNYIFKVGEIIGKQLEMYEEKKRVFPIEIENPRSYDREIILVFPEGYKIKNPEVFKMNEVLQYEGEVVADFISDYEIKENQVIVKNTESYNFTELPAELYPQYQKIINAAADFNKLSVILEKK